MVPTLYIFWPLCFLMMSVIIMFVLRCTHAFNVLESCNILLLGYRWIFSLSFNAIEFCDLSQFSNLGIDVVLA